MALTEESAVDVREVLARPITLALRSKGAVIPTKTGTSQTEVLTVAQLLLLEGLASGPTVVEPATLGTLSATGADRAEVDRLLDQLRAQGVLVPVDDEIAVDVVVGSAALPRPLASGDVLPTQILAGVPLLFRLAPGGFEALDHDANLRMRLSAIEFAVLTAFCRATSPAAAFQHQQRLLGDAALDEVGFEGFVRQCLAVDLLLDASPGDGTDRSAGKSQRLMLQLITRQIETRASVQNRAAEHDAETLDLGLTRVVPVDDLSAQPSLSLGMLMAHAVAHGGQAVQDHFDLYPNWGFSTERIGELSDRPALFMFSNYVWCHERNLGFSADAKRANPHSVTLHGGPDTPRYEGDEVRYFQQNPHVDITVRGEGEATFTEVLKALAGHMGDGPPDLSPLRDVEGVTFRLGDEVVRTPDRDRIVDLEEVPSPFLTGLFDAHGDVGVLHTTIETNRGCPYGCTYCDWGSATLSRIRKFPLERVFAELEWCAKHQSESIWVADANFGIFDRDVEIAQKVADLKREYGYPNLFTTNYAKNTVKHLQKIIEIMSEAGILTNGLLSLQSMDTDTLLTIRRSNIKTEKYEALSREFRKADLPLFVDIMLGLPGSTRVSFANDLQECLNRELYAKIFPTELLVNSPMNDPEYRTEHKIETQAPSELNGGQSGPRRFTDRPLVVSTATFSRDDFDHMMELRRVFFLCENFGALRQVSRHVRQTTGMREIDLYQTMLADSAADPQRWPYIALTMQLIPDFMVPPVSWRLFIDELKGYLVEAIGVPDDSALATVLRVQHALLPERERAFPCSLHLDHDYAEWHRQLVAAKDGDHREDWTSVVPPLHTFGPATFAIDDPHSVCERARGFRVDLEYDADWELASPVGRAMPHRHTDM